MIVVFAFAVLSAMTRGAKKASRPPSSRKTVRITIISGEKKDSRCRHKPPFAVVYFFPFIHKRPYLDNGRR